MEIVDSAVSSIRTSYRSLLIIICIGLIFLSVPVKVDWRQKGINELETLSKLDLQMLIELYVISHPKVSPQLETLTSIAEAHDLKLEYYTLYPYSDWITYPNYLLINFPIPDLSNATLEDIMPFFEKRKIPFGMIVLQDELLNVTRSIMEQIQEGDGPKKFTIYVNHSKPIRHKRGDPIPYGVEAKLHGKQSGWVKAPLSQEPEFVRMDLDIDWFEVFPKAGYSDITEGSDDLPLFSGIRHHWNSIRLETVANARTELARTNKPKDVESFQFAGLRIPLSLIGSVFPVAIFFLVGHLYLHLRHLRNHVLDVTELGIFPWIPIMPGIVPLIVALLTIVVLPLFIISDIALFRADLRPSSVTWAFGFACIFGTLLTFYELVKLRSTLRQTI